MMILDRILYLIKWQSCCKLFIHSITLRKQAVFSCLQIFSLLHRAQFIAVVWKFISVIEAGILTSRRLIDQYHSLLQ